MKKKEKDIAVKWARGNITHAQVKRELQVNGNTAYSILARSLKEIYQDTYVAEK